MSSDIVFEPSTSAVAQITQLSEMSMDEIKSLWRQLYRKEPPTHIRSFLEKRLAYRLQEVEFRRAHQNLAEKNDRRISAIINIRSCRAATQGLIAAAIAKSTKKQIVNYYCFHYFLVYYSLFNR